MFITVKLYQWYSSLWKLKKMVEILTGCLHCGDMLKIWCGWDREESTERADPKLPLDNSQVQVIGNAMKTGTGFCSIEKFYRNQWEKGKKECHSQSPSPLQVFSSKDVLWSQQYKPQYLSCSHQDLISDDRAYGYTSLTSGHDHVAGEIVVMGATGKWQFAQPVPHNILVKKLNFHLFYQISHCKHLAPGGRHTKIHSFSPTGAAITIQFTQVNKSGERIQLGSVIFNPRKLL